MLVLAIDFFSWSWKMSFSLNINNFNIQKIQIFPFLEKNNKSLTYRNPSVIEFFLHK
jgi:hypothetical protein